MVYVDDFKMSGPKENLSTGRQLIRQGIKTDEPNAVSKCLGCEHIIRDTIVNGKPIHEMECNMRPVMEQCVDSYLEQTKKSKSDLRPAKT
eukprot:5013552-Heterocapsa_arctica.AAC.1